MSNEVKSGILEKKGQKYFPVTDVSLVQGLQDLLSGKQEALVSGENIKTINGESILGSGNIESASAYYLQGTINLTSTPPTAIITSGSYAEAVEAYNAGSPVYIAMEESNEIVNVYPLAIIANGFIAFAGYGDDSFIVIVIPTTNSPEVVKAGVVHPEDISQFITNSVNNLVNYYTKTETYTKTEVAQLIANTLTGSFVSVNMLPPTPTADNLGKIYLVPSDVPDENNIKNEFIVEERNGSYYWEQIGSTTLSLDGYATIEDLEEAIDNVPFAEGAGTDSAEQWNCSASGNYSVASGYNTTAKGQASHSEGYDTNAAEQNSHAEGYHTTANGANAHIEGRSQNKPTDATITKNNDDLITDWNTKRFALAKGNASHVEGYNNLGLGNYSHAEGAGTIALGAQSHAEGNFTQTTNANEHAEGQWNQSNTGTIHSIGIGANANTRKNVFEVMSNGDAYLYGVGGYDGTNPGAAQDLASAISTKYTKPSTGIPASDLSDAVKYADELEILITLDEQSETIAYVLPADFNNIFTYKPRIITVTLPGEGQSLSFLKITEMPNYDQQDHSILLYGVSTGDTNIVLQIAENAPTVDGKRQVSVETMGVENVNHKVTTLSSSSDDMQYPSAKCVYDAIQASNTPEIFWATYGTTTAAEIDAAVQAGKTVMLLGTSGNNTVIYHYVGRIYGSSAYDFLSFTASYSNLVYYCRVRSDNNNWDSSAWQNVGISMIKSSWSATPSNSYVPSEKLVKDSIDAVDKVFWATYGTSTYADLLALYNSGKIVAMMYNDKVYTLQVKSSANILLFYCVDDYNHRWARVNSSDVWASGSYVLEWTNNRVSTISGNESDTSKYPNTKATYDAIHPAIATTQPAGGFLPNIFYNLGILSGNTTFDLATPADANVVNHYYWTFDTGSTAPTITWPTGLTWMGGSAPTINASKHYEISVLNGIGVAMEV